MKKNVTNIVPRQRIKISTEEYYTVEERKDMPDHIVFQCERGVSLTVTKDQELEIEN